jgi:hypothetical protein
VANYCSPALGCQLGGDPALALGNPSYLSVSGYATSEAPAARTLNVYNVTEDYSVYTLISSSTVPVGYVVTVWFSGAMTTRYANMIDPSTDMMTGDTYLAATGSWPTFQNMMIGGGCVASTGLHNQLGWGNCTSPDLAWLFEWDANTGIIHTGNGNCVDDFAYGLINNPIDEYSPTTQEIYLNDGSNMCLHATSYSIGSVDIQPCNGDDPSRRGTRLGR